MKVTALDDRGKYKVLFNDMDISSIVTEADDTQEYAKIYLFDTEGKMIRGKYGILEPVYIRGTVKIEKING